MLQQISRIGVTLPRNAYVLNALTSRQEAGTVECPKCNAGVGKSCVDELGQPKRSLHAQRHEAAIKAGAVVRYVGGKRVLYYTDDEENSDDSSAELHSSPDSPAPS